MHYLRNQKDINTYMGIFRTNNEKSDNRHGGGKKTARIVTRLFLVIVFLLLILVCYNLIVGSNDSPRSMMEEEEEMRDNVLKDTFDVVGDYAIRGMRLSDEIVDTDTPDKDEEKSDSKQTASSAIHTTMHLMRVQLFQKTRNRKRLNRLPHQKRMSKEVQLLLRLESLR